MKKAADSHLCQPLDFIGRDGVIRTHDPLHPMQVRYLAAPRPENMTLYQHFQMLSQRFWRDLDSMQAIFLQTVALEDPKN